MNVKQHILFLGISFVSLFGIGQSTDELLKLALNDSLEAIVSLSEAYRFGNGVEAQEDSCYKWTLRAAQLQHAESQYLIGLHWISKIFSKTQYGWGITWLERSAKQNHPEAFQKLREIYLDPGTEEGKKRMTRRYFDQRIANSYTREWAKTEDVRGKYYLGLDYYKGIGVEVQLDSASKWLEISANKGLPDAQLALGQLLFEGNESGVPDVFGALDWFQKAHINGKSNIDQKTEADIKAHRVDQFLKMNHNYIMETGFLFPPEIFQFILRE